jgi:superfamily I DNA/RNA helicase
LLGPEVSDVDGNIEKRSGTVSVFNGPLPKITICDSAEQEINKVGTWLRSLSEESVAPHETAIFVRSSAEFGRAQSVAAAGDMPAKTIDETTETTHGFLTIATMHRAKGLEYRAVAVMACDDEVLPLQERIENVADDADLAEVYETERHLLYVACTRARDFLHVSGVDPASEFLDDMQVNSRPDESPGG